MGGGVRVAGGTLGTIRFVFWPSHLKSRYLEVFDLYRNDVYAILSEGNDNNKNRS